MFCSPFFRILTVRSADEATAPWRAFAKTPVLRLTRLFGEVFGPPGLRVD